jgi:hypothetical protein
MCHRVPEKGHFVASAATTSFSKKDFDLWRYRYFESLCQLVELRRMVLAGHVARLRKINKLVNILVRKSK